MYFSNSSASDPRHCPLRLGCNLTSFCAIAVFSIASIPDLTSASMAPVEEGGIVQYGAADAQHVSDLREIKAFVDEGTGRVSDAAVLRLPAWVAAHPQDAESLYYLAELYRLDSPHFREKRAEAVGLLRRASELGFAPAKTSLGARLITGEGVPVDRKAGLALIREALAAHDPVSHQVLGVLKLGGIGLPQDLLGARDLLRKAVELGRVRSHSRLAMAYAALGESDKAVAEMTAGVKADDADAMTRMAIWLVTPSSAMGRTDPAEALRLVRRAVEQNYPPAQCLLARFYGAGLGSLLPRDDAQFIKWITAAARRGDESAQYGIGIAHLNGIGVARDEAVGVRALIEAMEMGSPDAAYALGRAHLEGAWGLPRDEAKGRQLIEQAAWNGHPQARGQLSRQRPGGDPGAPGVGMTDAEARRLIVKMRAKFYQSVEAATAADVERFAAWQQRNPNDAEALLCLSLMYCCGPQRNLPGKLAEGTRLLERAADMDFAPARSTWGGALIRGDAARSDPRTGLTQLQRSMLEQDTLALFVMGSVKLEGPGGVRPDPAAARELFREAAARGMAKANAGLALALLELGEEGEALKSLESGAATGDPESMVQLASLKLKQKPSGDAGGAFNWMKRAAELGHGEAQYHIAMFYRKGTGTPVDQGKAFDWLKRSADGGNAKAKHYLAAAYFRGDGVEKT